MELIGRYSKAIIMCDGDMDSGVTSQIYDFLNCKMTEGEKVRIMPDFHLGSGCVIGYTQTYSGGPLDPDAIGVDQGCGVVISEIKLKDATILDRLDLVDQRIRKAVPMGQNIHNKSCIKEKEFRKFLKSRLERARSLWPELIKYEGLGEIDNFISKTLRRLGMDEGIFYKSLGTLGGGNHFIELGKSDSSNNPDTVFLTIHTGSRNLGVKVLSYWSKKIKNVRVLKEDLTNGIKEIRFKFQDNPKKIEAEIKKLRDSGEHTISPSRFLEREDDISGYLCDLVFSTSYAEYNRACIIENIIKLFPGAKEVERIESVHNYIDLTDKVIRKGAISAPFDKKVVIPINMSYGVLIGKGLGNIDWNNSAPHGAGRKLSRGQAKKNISLNEFKLSMGDIYSSSIVDSCIDEAPSAYKDPEEIIPYISNSCITLIDRIKPILSIKSI